MWRAILLHVPPRLLIRPAPPHTSRQLCMALMPWRHRSTRQARPSHAPPPQLVRLAMLRGTTERRVQPCSGCHHRPAQPPTPGPTLVLWLAGHHRQHPRVRHRPGGVRRVLEGKHHVLHSFLPHGQHNHATAMPLGHACHPSALQNPVQGVVRRTHLWAGHACPPHRTRRVR